MQSFLSQLVKQLKQNLCGSIWHTLPHRCHFGKSVSFDNPCL